MVTYIGGRKLSEGEKQTFYKSLKSGSSGREAIQAIDKPKVSAGSIGLTGEDINKLITQKGGAMNVSTKDIETRATTKLSKETGLSRKTASDLITGRLRSDDNLVVLREGGRSTLATAKAADILISEREQAIKRQQAQLKTQEKERKKQQIENTARLFGMETEASKREDRQRKREKILQPYTQTVVDFSIRENLKQQAIKNFVSKQIVPKNIITSPKNLVPQIEGNSNIFKAYNKVEKGKNVLLQLQKSSELKDPNFLERQKLLRSDETITPQQKLILQETPKQSNVNLLKSFALVPAFIELGAAEATVNTGVFLKEAGANPKKAFKEMIDVKSQYQGIKQRIVQEPISGISNVVTQYFIFKKGFTAIKFKAPSVVSEGNLFRGISLSEITPRLTPVALPKSIILIGKATFSFDKTTKASALGIGGKILTPREVVFTIEKGKFGKTSVTRTSFPLEGKTRITATNKGRTSVYEFVEGQNVAKLTTAKFGEGGNVLATETLKIPISDKGVFNKVSTTDILRQQKQNIVFQPSTQKIRTSYFTFNIPKDSFAAQVLNIKETGVQITRKNALLSREFVVSKVFKEQTTSRITRATQKLNQKVGGIIERPSFKETYSVLETKGIRPELKFNKGIEIKPSELKPLTNPMSYIDEKRVFKTGQIIEKTTFPKEIIDQTTKTSLNFETNIFKQPKQIKEFLPNEKISNVVLDIRYNINKLQLNKQLTKRKLKDIKQYKNVAKKLNTDVLEILPSYLKPLYQKELQYKNLALNKKINFQGGLLKNKKAQLTLQKPKLKRKSEFNITELTQTNLKKSISQFKLPSQLPKIKAGSKFKTGFASLSLTAQSQNTISSRINKTTDRTIQRQVQSPFQKIVQKPIQRQVQKPLQKVIQRPIQKTIQKPIQQTVQKPINITKFSFFKLPLIPKMPILPQGKISKKGFEGLNQKLKKQSKQETDFTRSAFGAAFNIKATKERKYIITGLRV